MQPGQPRREDIIVDGRRYRRFVYDNPKSYVLDEMPGQAPLTFSAAESAKNRPAKAHTSGRRLSHGKIPDFTGLDADGQPLKELNSLPIVERKKGEESMFTLTIPDVPSVLLPCLDTVALDFASFTSTKPVEGASNVTITTSTRAQLQHAHFITNNTLEQAREKKGYTHFFCVPFAKYGGEGEVNNKFSQCDTGNVITDKVSDLVNSLPALEPSIHTSYAMPSPKLHVTLFLLTLLSTKEINRCKNVLSNAAPLVYDTVGSTSVLLNLHGLGYFGNKERADVLWLGMHEVGKPGLATIASNIPAPDGPQKCPRLARAIGVLSSLLQKEGLLSVASAQKQKLGENGVNCGVAWHLTLLNTKYGYKHGRRERRDSNSVSIGNSESSGKSDNSGHKRSQKMNLSEILEKHGNFDVGTHRAPCIQLCRLNHQPWFPAVTPEIRPNGYYVIEATLPLP